MIRSVFVSKANITIYTRFNAINESKDSSVIIMKSIKIVIQIRKRSEPNTRTRRDVRSNTIIEYTFVLVYIG